MEKKKEEILKILNKDARTSVKEISEKLDISKKKIEDKIKELKDEGIIKGFYPILDSTKLGYNTTACILVKIGKGKFQVVEKRLSGYDEAKVVYGLTGRYDALVVGKFEDKDHLNQFIDLLHRIGGVEDTETFIVLDEIKEDFRIRFSRESYWKS